MVALLRENPHYGNTKIRLRFEASIQCKTLGELLATENGLTKVEIIRAAAKRQLTIQGYWPEDYSYTRWQYCGRCRRQYETQQAPEWRGYEDQRPAAVWGCGCQVCMECQYNLLNDYNPRLQERPRVVACPFHYETTNIVRFNFWD